MTVEYHLSLVMGNLQSTSTSKSILLQGYSESLIKIGKLEWFIHVELQTQQVICAVDMDFIIENSKMYL